MSESGGMPDISGIINGLMQNPEFANLVKEMRPDGTKNGADIQSEMMSKLPEIMSLLGPMNNGKQSSSEENFSEKKSQQKQESVNENIPKFLKNIDKFDRAKATRLMTALKPYLSRERCGMIDKCMSVMQIGDVMTVLRGLDGISKYDN